jgi:hypothetical protein
MTATRKLFRQLQAAARLLAVVLRNGPQVRMWQRGLGGGRLSSHLVKPRFLASKGVLVGVGDDTSKWASKSESFRSEQ